MSLSRLVLGRKTVTLPSSIPTVAVSDIRWRDAELIDVLTFISCVFRHIKALRRTLSLLVVLELLRYWFYHSNGMF